MSTSCGTHPRLIKDAFEPSKDRVISIGHKKEEEREEKDRGG